MDEDLETSDDHTPPAGAAEFLEQLADDRRRRTEDDLAIGELATERAPHRAHPRLIPRRFARAASSLIAPKGVPLRDFALGLATVPRRRR